MSQGKQVSYRQKGKDLALGRLCFLTGSVSRCLGSSCGRKDAHPVFPDLELLFCLLPLPLLSVDVQLMGGLRCLMKCGLRRVEEAGGMAGLANLGGEFIAGGRVGREVMVALQAGGY